MPILLYTTNERCLRFSSPTKKSKKHPMCIVKCYVMSFDEAENKYCITALLTNLEIKLSLALIFSFWDNENGLQ